MCVVLDGASNYEFESMRGTEERQISIQSDGAVLEARLAVPGNPKDAIVFCHPHPQYGGDMDNLVVSAVVGAFAGHGWATLRFNFRGVGASTGSFDNLVGERSDAAAALAALAEHCPQTRLNLGGYSFGAAIALDLGLSRSDVVAIVAVAPPFARMPAPSTAAAKPIVMAVGDSDQFCPVAAFQDAVHALGPAVRSAVLAGADHFFFGREKALADRIVELCDVD